MVYDICLDVASLMILTIIAVSMFNQYSAGFTEQNRRFINITGVMLLTVLLDIVTAVFIDRSELIPVWLNMALNSLYFMSLAFMVYCYIKYMESFIDEEMLNGAVRLVNKIIMITYCAAAAVNIFTGYMIYFDEDLIYSRGPGYLLIYAVPFYLFVYGTLLMRKNRKNLEFRQYFSIMTVVPFTLVGTVMQIIFMPDHLLVLFFATLSAMVIYFNLETPDYKRLKITMEQLEESRREAEKANMAKSEFLANMSHEIRTPMNAIIGMCELIMREKDISTTTADYCMNIRNSGKNLIAIINDILDFSKIEAGSLEIIEDRFNLASPLNNVINMAIARKGDRKLDIIVNAEPDIPCSLMGDEMRIRQVIINLVSNAVKYTREGGVFIDVTHERNGDSITLRVSVKDTGIGISEDDIKKLFNSFQQVDTKKNRSVEGTGLGLAISKRLSDKMNGRITVESEPGKGSDFTLELPLKIMDEAPFVCVPENIRKDIKALLYIELEKFTSDTVRDYYLEAAGKLGAPLGIELDICHDFGELKKAVDSGVTHIITESEEYLAHRDHFDNIPQNVELIMYMNRSDVIETPARVRMMFKPLYSLSLASVFDSENEHRQISDNLSLVNFTAPGAKILVVDDNEINLDVAEGLMEPYGMQIVTAKSGTAAIETLESSPDFHLVFMDHMMPVMDGVEAVGIIRRNGGDYYTSLPIVALTANAVNDAKVMFMDSGFNDFLAKPVEISALDSVLKKWLPPELIIPADAPENKP